MFRHGFLGNDASLMLDVVVCALALVVPLLAWGLYLVKVRRDYARHRNVQMLIAVIVGLAVVAFEVDMRLQGGWRNIVNKDAAAPRLGESQVERVEFVLGVHLVFAITTPVLWAITIWQALKRFPKPPRPGAHSAVHKALGWASTIDLVLTSITGLVFYYMAFISP